MENICINCGEPGSHFVPPSLGEEGFFICKKKIKEFVEKEKPIVNLENWSVVSNVSPYLAPESINSYIVGQCYNHPKHIDGKIIHLSHPIISFNEMENKIETNNSIYILGKIDTEYEKAYSNAKDRFWKTIQKEVK